MFLSALKEKFSLKHSNNILLAMLCDKDDDVQRIGVKRSIK